jgi:hypothetical protein
MKDEVLTRPGNIVNELTFTAVKWLVRQLEVEDD